MSDEVIIDVDGDSQLETRKLAEMIKRQLIDKTAKFSMWKTGGTGFHFHLFYPELQTMPKFERDEIKRLIIRDLCGGLMRPRQVKAHVCMANPVLIQLENCIHRKGGKKTVIFESSTTSIVENNKLPPYILPQREKQKIAQANYKTPLPGKTPEEIKILEGEDFTNLRDGRKRAAFVLAAYHKQNGTANDKIFEKMLSWNDYRLKGGLSRAIIRNTVESVLKHNYGWRRQAGYLLEDLGIKLIS